MRISTNGDIYYFLECGHMFIVEAREGDKYQVQSKKNNEE